VHSTDEAAWSAYLDLTRQRAEQLLRADDPYDVALQLWGDSAKFLTSEHSGNMSALWGALTDWVERKPDEEADVLRADVDSRRAAIDRSPVSRRNRP
jgi:hypothetical protein